MDKPAAVPQSTELLPCPFCGGEGVVHKGDQVFWTECHTCNLDLEYQTSREDAIAAWNTRTPAASPTAGAAEGHWPEGCVQRAFVDGARWWQFHHNGSTVFPSERNEAEAEAARRYGQPSASGEVCPQCGGVAVRQPVTYSFAYGLAPRPETLEVTHMGWECACGNIMTDIEGEAARSDAIIAHLHTRLAEAGGWIAVTQDRIRSWVESRLGVDAMIPRERGLRQLEESIELAQSVGVTREEAVALVGHVFAKPPGDPAQELGGAALTLLACAEGIGHHLGNCAETELTRIETLPPEKFRRRQALNASLGLGAPPVAAEGLDS